MVKVDYDVLLSVSDYHKEATSFRLQRSLVVRFAHWAFKQKHLTWAPLRIKAGIRESLPCIKQLPDHFRQNAYIARLTMSTLHHQLCTCKGGNEFWQVGRQD